MLCPRCTSLVDASAGFCPSCLNELPNEPVAPRSEPRLAPAPEPELAPAPVPATFEARFPGQQECGVHPGYPVAATCQRCGKFICVRCAPELSTAEQASCADCTDRAAQGGGLPLGGWLILVAISVALGPIGMLVRCGRIASAIFDSYQARHALSVMQAEMLGLYALMFALAIYGVVVAIAFFGLRRSTPRLVIINLALYVAFCLLRAGLEHGFSKELVMANVTAVMRSAIGAAIWIPYFSVSKRVKATFVR